MVIKQHRKEEKQREKLTGNLKQELLKKFQSRVQETRNGQRTLDSMEKTQKYMVDHFHRNMTRKSGIRILQEPDYLSHFHYKEEPTLGEKYTAVKKGEYSLEKEEVLFTELLRGLSTKSRLVDRKFRQVGLLNFVPHSTHTSMD